MSAVLPSSSASSDAADDSDQKQPSAAQRLAESRERLRQWMLRGDSRHEARRRAAAAEAEGGRAALMDRLRAMPIVGVVIDALSAWWSHHPMQPAVNLAETVVREAVAPAARRHPLLVLAAAFAIGAAAVRFKPWRWIIAPGMVGGLLSHVATRALAQFPFESVLGAMSSFAHSRQPEQAQDEMGPPAPASVAQQEAAEEEAVAS